MGLSSREVEDKRFSVSRRGFDKDEVVAYLAQVGKQMSLTEQQLAITEAKAARTQQELDRLNDVLETRIAEAQQACPAPAKVATPMPAAAIPAMIFFFMVFSVFRW